MNRKLRGTAMQPSNWPARWRSIENDNGLKGPIWAHHAFKAFGALAIFEAILVSFLVFGIPFRLALPTAMLYHVIFFIVLRVAYWLDHTTDADHPETFVPALVPRSFFTADFACDAALHVLLALPLAAWYAGRPLDAVTGLAIFLSVYLPNFEHAAP